MKKSILSVILIFCLMLGLGTTAVAAMPDDVFKSVVTDTAEYIYKTVKSPQVGSIGGEWAMLGLARSDYELPEEYYQDYFAAVEEYVRACNGVLHEKKYTEYSRVIVAMSALGVDARSVAGYDLTKALGDYDKTIWQGINGPIWALIALDSRDYPMPVNDEAKTQATRQMYIDCILEAQLPNGGWSLTGSGEPDPDITGMALQALAKYQEQEKVKKATEEALVCMSEMQDKNGGFASWGTYNSESVVQMICALCELGIPLDDVRFVKNGNTMLDNLMTFYQQGNGFQHTVDESESNLMASEQGLYALVAVHRINQGKNSLYRMSDAKSVVGTQVAGMGLPGKHADVKAMPLTYPGKTFTDISEHNDRLEIEALAAHGIIDGKGEGKFDPDATMTRAEFATIVTRGLGLVPKANDSFTDVKSSDWFSGYVGTASQYGIIQGKGEGIFDPNQNITRQEAAVMVSRAAKLCGLDTERDSITVRDTLAQFSDYVKTAEWARQGLAFCYAEGILDDGELEINGMEAIKRCEIAQMFFNLLNTANLL